MRSKRVLTRSAPRTPASGTAIITDPLEIRRLLTRAASGWTASSLKVRTPSQSGEILLRGSLLDVDPTREGLHLKLSAPAKKGSLEGRECMLLIYLQGRSILGSLGVPSEILGDIVRFPLPTRVFKIQRRKDVRFQIPTAYEFTLEIDSVRKRIVDLSESGLSFLALSAGEAALFPRGALLHHCVIRMQSYRIKTALKIRNHLPIERGKPEAGIKIGAEFEDLSPEDRECVAQFVYSHASHLFY